MRAHITVLVDMPNDPMLDEDTEAMSVAKYLKPLILNRLEMDEVLPPGSSVNLYVFQKGLLANVEEDE